MRGHVDCGCLCAISKRNPDGAFVEACPVICLLTKKRIRKESFVSNVGGK